MFTALLSDQKSMRKATVVRDVINVRSRVQTLDFAHQEQNKTNKQSVKSGQLPPLAKQSSVHIYGDLLSWVFPPGP